MWYRNIGSMFFCFVTKHACDRQTDERTDGRTDRQTDRQTDELTIPKTALTQLLRAVKIDNTEQSTVCRTKQSTTWSIPCGFQNSNQMSNFEMNIVKRKTFCSHMACTRRVSESFDEITSAKSSMPNRKHVCAESYRVDNIAASSRNYNDSA